ncbi:uncharacterized protein [Bemisia tabaci]|uniref:uncharacterized protein n=1 Tax=Bemisia tabaci TaxID=7038 RepID=UPI003B284E3E
MALTGTLQGLVILFFVGWYTIGVWKATDQLFKNQFQKYLDSQTTLRTDFSAEKTSGRFPRNEDDSTGAETGGPDDVTAKPDDVDTAPDPVDDDEGVCYLDEWPREEGPVFSESDAWHYEL